MGFLTKLLGSGGGGSGDSDGGSTQIQRPAQRDSSISPWDRVVGMSQAAGPAKALLTQGGGNPTAAAAQTPGQRRAAAAGENPAVQAWDRYMQNYGSTGQPVDPMDADIFQRIWK